MRTMKEINANAFELLGDPTRQKIVSLLRVKESTVSQIAAEVGLTAPAVYHHIRKMLKAGLVEVSHEERLGHIIESYYRTTANAFTSTFGQISLNKSQTDFRAVLQGLNEIGFKISISKDFISRLTCLDEKMEKLVDIEGLNDAISSLESYDLLTVLKIKTYAGLQLMSDDESDEYVKTIKELRSVLRFSVREQPRLHLKQSSEN